MAQQEISKLSVLLLFNTENFEKKLSDVQRHTKKSGAALTRVGQQVSLGISLPLAIAGQKIAETSTAFEYQMARVQAISGATSQSFVRLQKNAEELGASTIYTATSVGQLQEEYAKLGFTASEITAVTESTLSLAQVTGADLGRAAEIAGSTLRIFGKDVSDVGQVNDVIAVAISQSALDFESFAETMKYAGSQAAISAVSMEEISAAMGVLANRGVKGSIAGTRLRMILAKLAEEGGNTHDKFIELINGSMTMTEAIDRFGVRAASAVPVLQENRDEFFALENSMIQAAGTLEVMQEVMDDTSFSVQKRLVSALENLSIQFGKVLLPVVNFVVEAVIHLVNGFSRMPGVIKVLVVAIGTLLTVVPPLLFLLGQAKLALLDLSIMFPRVGMALSTMLGPIGLAVTAVSLLAIGLYDMFVSGSQAEGMLGRIEAANAAAGEAAGRVLGPIKSLIAEFGNENTTLLRKQEILNELMRSQPDYFNNLNTETTTVDDLALAYDRLSSAIQQTAKMRALQSQLTRISQEQAAAIGEQVKAQLELEDIEQRAAAGERGYAPYQTTIMGGDGGRTGMTQMTIDPKLARKKELNQVINDQQAIFDDLQRQAIRLQEMMVAEDGVAGLLARLSKMGRGGTGGGFSGDMGEEVSDLEKVMNRLATTLNAIDKEAEMFGTDGLKIGEQRLAAYTAAFKSLVDLSFEGQDVKDNLEMVKKEIQQLVGTVGEGQKLEEVNDALDKYFDRNDSLLNQYQAGLLTAEEARNQQMSMLASTLPTLIDLMGEEDAMVQALIASYLALKKAKDESNESTEDTLAVEKAQMQLTRQLNDVVMNFGASLGQAATDSKSFGQGVLQAIKDAVLATLELAYARIITNALDPKNPANQASFGLAGLGAAALGMGLLTGMIRGIEIPSFSKGGIVQGTQLAMVGDNRSGREAIIPLEKLPSLMQKMGGYGGTRVYGHLSGYDIALSSERSGKRFQRISY
jgi:hypothetical protein